LPSAAGSGRDRCRLPSTRLPPVAAEAKVF
jgi:hypothetical protein